MTTIELTQSKLEQELTHVLRILSKCPKSDLNVKSIVIGINSNRQYGSDEYVESRVKPLLKQWNVEVFS